MFDWFVVLFFSFDTQYIIKYLLTETSGKQYVLWILDCRCFPRLRLGKHRQSLVHKTYCFPRSQSISVKYSLEWQILFLQFQAERLCMKAQTIDLNTLHIKRIPLKEVIKVILILSIRIGYHMRGEVISVLSLEGRYHTLSRLSAANEGQNTIS